MMSGCLSSPLWITQAPSSSTAMKIMSVSVPRLYFVPLTLLLAGHLNTIVCTASDWSYPEGCLCHVWFETEEETGCVKCWRRRRMVGLLSMGIERFVCLTEKKLKTTKKLLLKNPLGYCLGSNVRYVGRVCPEEPVIWSTSACPVGCLRWQLTMTGGYNQRSEWLTQVYLESGD